MAPHSEKMKMLRVVVREDFTRSRCDALLADFKLALQTLDKLDAKKIQEHKEYVFPVTTFHSCCLFLFRLGRGLFGER